jgi:MFS transporter, putative metabolite:H+ symporter
VPFRSLLAPPYLGRLVVLMSMWFFWYIGNYGFLGDAATLFSAHGQPIGSSILYLGIGAVGYPVGSIIMAVLADRVERRLLIFASTLVWLAGMIVVGTLASEAALTAGSFLASLALGLYLQVAYTYTAESFPTRARASGFALSDGLGHGGGALGALVLPTVVASVSFFGVRGHRRDRGYRRPDRFARAAVKRALAGTNLGLTAAPTGPRRCLPPPGRVATDRYVRTWRRTG